MDVNLKMGKPQSKNQKQEGVTNVNVNLEEHMENNQLLHDAHEWKLWIILVLCCIQVMYVMYVCLVCVDYKKQCIRMANYVLPWLSNPVALNGGMDTSGARRFATGTSRTAAQGLRQGVEEALRSGNESEFNNAYLIYSGQLPSKVHPNDGGECSDVLRRLITVTSAVVNPATLSQQDLIRLGQRLNSSDSAARADCVVNTPLLLTTAPAGVDVTLSGHRTVRLDVNNPVDVIITRLSLKDAALAYSSVVKFHSYTVEPVAHSNTLSMLLC